MSLVMYDVTCICHVFGQSGISMNTWSKFAWLRLFFVFCFFFKYISWISMISHCLKADLNFNDFSRAVGTLISHNFGTKFWVSSLWGNQMKFHTISVKFGGWHLNHYGNCPSSDECHWASLMSINTGDGFALDWLSTRQCWLQCSYTGVTTPLC